MEKLLGAAVIGAVSIVSMAHADGTGLLSKAIQSAAATKWNEPQEPMKIYGDTYYVGVAGLSSILIHTDAGLILLDGDLQQPVPLIEGNIRKLGFRVEDMKLILNAHAQFDHAGGIAEEKTAAAHRTVRGIWCLPKRHLILDQETANQAPRALVRPRWGLGHVGSQQPTPFAL